MNFQDPGQTPIARDMVLPARSAETLFAGADAPGHNIERCVRPFHLTVSPIERGVRLAGDEVAVSLAEAILGQIVEALELGQAVSQQSVIELAISTVDDALKHRLAFRLNGIRNPVRPMSLSQVAFMNAMLFTDHPLIFGVGPTGTGKTHLAIAAGLTLVADKHFKSLVVTRPRGFSGNENSSPALRDDHANPQHLSPIEDVLRDLIGRDESKRQAEHGLLEVTTLDRMRGRSFNESFILIDEAQNMRKQTMRMALTRLGQKSRMVVTGDPAQSALAGDEPSGLPHILNLIAGTKIALVHQFRNHQIIRNDTVAKIEAIYSSEDHPGVRAAA